MTAAGERSALATTLGRRVSVGCNVAVRQRALDADGFLLGGNNGSALQHATQAFDFVLRPGREVAEGALPNFAVFAVAFAKQDGGRRVPVGVAGAEDPRIDEAMTGRWSRDAGARVARARGDSRMWRGGDTQPPPVLGRARGRRRREV